MLGNSISGRIFNSENRQGIAGLIITIFDLNQRFTFTPTTKFEEFIKNAIRFSSLTTDDNGTFSYNYSSDDVLALSQDKKQLDLFLVVTAHDDDKSAAGSKILYFTNPPRSKAGRSEFFNIGISKDILIKFNVIDESDLGNNQIIENKIGDYIRNNTYQQKLNDGIAAYHKQLVQKTIVEKTAFTLDFKNKMATRGDIISNSGVLIKADDDIQTGVKTVAESAIDKADANINTASNGVPVYLYLTADDRQRLFGTITTGEVQVGEDEIRNILLRTGNTGNAGTILVQNNPILKFCEENSTDQNCAKAHTGLSIGEVTGTDSSSGGGTGSGIVDTPVEALTNDTINKHIASILQAMPSSNEIMNPDSTNTRPDKAIIEKEVDEFSLGKGPAEVPAFYDFHSLQIAFDFVWRQLFDEDIVNMAFQVNYLYKSKFGIDFPFTNLGVFQSYNNFPVLLEVPAITAAHFEITKEEYNDLDQGKRDKLDSIAKELDSSLIVTWNVGQLKLSLDAFTNEKYFQKLTELGERIIETVTQDDYYTLHKTLRDLNDRIKSNYEFTVFAANKDYHSVNFGLLNTIRLDMKPLTYQAGKLVKTIPLTPKEERKYSLKITRNLKRASKEARKNNNSVTSERSSTSRIEAEIVAKAQNKTNFSLSTDGEYDIGISSGSGKTSFGVDAQSESAQNRKDISEAVVKAAQDSKNELSWEDSTEESSDKEHTESGTIVNPNDELAVTYLFYELQRRYSVSQQLYRVMPVVLVAQEVPSPDQITEAWVISNSWIINRFLLDDSYRPCLRYLTTKSVGDDFEVRELRKNLREQRNLVDTLKIEVSNAAREADNRYYALKKRIDERIREEQNENSDGFLFDTFQSVFGGGQNPEAAKAREIAAKDELQDAKDKLEKLSSTMQQEVNNLHNLTKDYNKALRNLLDSQLQVKHLLVHLRNNIIYYMQAIWSMEQPDQRFLRLNKVQVPNLESDGQRTCVIEVIPEKDIFQSFRAEGTTKHRGFLKGKLKKPITFNPLAEVADLDTMLGFKGNYMIFPLKQHNALTEFMAAPYIDTAFGAMDPDALSNVNLEDYSHYVCCLHDNLSPEKFAEQKPILTEWLKQLMADPLRNGDEIVVPTNSLFIEALPSTHPILENFKLRHRELDVYKVDEEVRKAKMENLRLASRLLNGERDDPNIEKKIVVKGNLDPNIDVGNP